MRGGGSDRLVDALVARGDEDAVRRRVQEHLDAGASHVVVQPMPTADGGFEMDEIRRLGAALLVRA
jgi:hypothetical protein